MSRAVFTVCSINYIRRAVTLMNSVQDEVEKIILVVDRLDEELRESCEKLGVKIIFVQEINFPNFNQSSFFYNIIELNTAVKPYFSLSMMKKFEKVIYLDPDVLVYDGLNAIWDLLDSNDFILTPHAISSPADDKNPGDIEFLRFGLYNLGFFAFRSCANSEEILDWWHSKLENGCFYEPAAGYGVDQKYCDLLPIYFDDVKIAKNIGLNIAFWNLHERELSLVDGVPFANGLPALFIHFSSVTDGSLVANKQDRFLPGEEEIYLRLMREYLKKVEDIGLNKDLDDREYSYAVFKGLSVTDIGRRCFFHLSKAGFFNDGSPFESDELFRYLKKRRLLINRGSQSTFQNYKEITRYKKSVMFINIFFRLALKVLGASRYQQMLRYLSYISNTLNQNKILGK